MTKEDENGRSSSRSKTDHPIHITDQDGNLMVQTTDGVIYDKGLIKNGMIYNNFYGDRGSNNNIWAGYTDDALPKQSTNPTLKRQSSAHYDKFWHKSNLPIVVSDCLLPDIDHNLRETRNSEGSPVEDTVWVRTKSNGQIKTSFDLSEDQGTNTLGVTPNTPSPQVTYSVAKKFEFNTAALAPNKTSMSTKSDQPKKARINGSPNQRKVSLELKNTSLEVPSLRNRNLMSGFSCDPIEEMADQEDQPSPSNRNIQVPNLKIESDNGQRPESESESPTTDKQTPLLAPENFKVDLTRKSYPEIPAKQKPKITPENRVKSKKKKSGTPGINPKKYYPITETRIEQKIRRLSKVKAPISPIQEDEMDRKNSSVTMLTANNSQAPSVCMLSRESPNLSPGLSCRKKRAHTKDNKKDSGDSWENYCTPSLELATSFQNKQDFGLGLSNASLEQSLRQDTLERKTGMRRQQTHGE